MTDEPWEHLKAYGYAPGGYMNRCSRCQQMCINLDKRANSCRPCAEKRHAEVTAQPAQTREHIADADCWCIPAIDYTDPETGVSVYVHRNPQ